MKAIKWDQNEINHSFQENFNFKFSTHPFNSYQSFRVCEVKIYGTKNFPFLFNHNVFTCSSLWRVFTAYVKNAIKFISKSSKEKSFEVKFSHTFLVSAIKM